VRQARFERVLKICPPLIGTFFMLTVASSFPARTSVCRSVTDETVYIRKRTDFSMFGLPAALAEIYSQAI